jgi:hypothetical protein
MPVSHPHLISPGARIVFMDQCELKKSDSLLTSPLIGGTVGEEIGQSGLEN